MRLRSDLLARPAAGARISNVPVTQFEEDPYTTAQPFIVAEKSGSAPAAFAHANEPRAKTVGKKFELDGIKVPAAEPRAVEASAKFQLDNIQLSDSGPVSQVVSAVSAVKLGAEPAARYEVEPIEPPIPEIAATFELQPFESLSEASAALPEIYALAAAAERAAAQAAMANRVIHEELSPDEEVEINADDTADPSAIIADAESAISHAHNFEVVAKPGDTDVEQAGSAAGTASGTSRSPRAHRRRGSRRSPPRWPQP